VARFLGVKWNEVVGWSNSPTAHFPLPVGVLGPKGNRPLWTLEQVPGLRAWLATRLGLSDPVAHWELIDRGGEQPGGHQDQMAMFAMEQAEKEKEPEDGLFSVL
jgi:hypothetical protein